MGWAQILPLHSPYIFWRSGGDGDLFKQISAENLQSKINRMPRYTKTRIVGRARVLALCESESQNFTSEC